MIGCGAQLETLLAVAQQRVLLVAPFIKQPIVTRLLAGIRPEVSVTIYTRWRADEVAAGVSDLGVFDEVRGRDGANLMLCANLHAKYYRSDERVLVGSANLTATALGWTPSCNLELLFETGSDCEQFKDFERRLALRSVPTTAEIRDAVQQAAAALPGVVTVEHLPAAPTAMGDATWIPRTRHPEVLFRAYVGRSDELTSSGREQSLADIADLHPPSGLSDDRFRLFVASVLVQTTVVAALDQMLVQPRRFGEIRDVIGQRLADDGSTRDPSEAWQTLMRWLLLFLPHRYVHNVPRYSEIFSRRPPAP